jgi:hypothetical protein
MRNHLFAPMAALVILALSPSVSAQQLASSIAGNIPFEFNIGDKAYPAGQYRVTSNLDGRPAALTIANPEKKITTVLMIMTRLARQHMGDAPKGSLVFDKVEDKRILSEIWMGDRDGFLIHATARPHTHHVVDIKQ